MTFTVIVFYHPSMRYYTTGTGQILDILRHSLLGTPELCEGCRLRFCLCLRIRNRSSLSSVESVEFGNFCCETIRLVWTQLLRNKLRNIVSRVFPALYNSAQKFGLTRSKEFIVQNLFHGRPLCWIWLQQPLDQFLCRWRHSRHRNVILVLLDLCVCVFQARCLEWWFTNQQCVSDTIEQSSLSAQNRVPPSFQHWFSTTFPWPKN